MSFVLERVQEQEDNNMMLMGMLYLQDMEQSTVDEIFTMLETWLRQWDTYLSAKHNITHLFRFLHILTCTTEKR